MGKSEKVILRCNKVSKIYKSGMQQTKALSGVSLSFNEASINLIYGKSGSGKSTLLNVLAGIDSASDGDIFFQGKNYTVMTEREMAKLRGDNYGFIFQAYHLIPHITAKENIMCPSYVNGKPIDTKYFSFLLQELGITDLVLKCPYELSGGEQQMLAMGRALMSKPSLIVMDEPSMGLSPLYVNEIFKLIEDIHNSGTTVLLIEQNAKKALSIADRAYVLETGNITLSGKASDLMDNDLVKKAYLSE